MKFFLFILISSITYVSSIQIIRKTLVEQSSAHKNLLEKRQPDIDNLQQNVQNTYDLAADSVNTTINTIYENVNLAVHLVAIDIEDLIHKVSLNIQKATVKNNWGLVECWERINMVAYKLDSNNIFECIPKQIYNDWSKQLEEMQSFKKIADNIGNYCVGLYPSEEKVMKVDKCIVSEIKKVRKLINDKNKKLSQSLLFTRIGTSRCAAVKKYDLGKQISGMQCK